MEIHYGRHDPIDFELLVQTMPDKEFQNLTRSTLPLLFYWRDHARDSLRESLCSFCEAVHAPSKLYVGLQKVLLSKGNSYSNAEAKLRDCDKDDTRAQAVRRAILDGELFAYVREEQIDWISRCDEAIRTPQTCQLGRLI